MQVRRVPAARRDRVDVHVEDRVLGRDLEGRKPGLLARLAQGRAEHRRVGLLRVAAGLQPAAELAVQDEQERRAVGPRDDGAARDVALGVVALKRIVRRGEESADVRERLGFPRVGRRVARERREQRLALHAGRRSRKSAVQSSSSPGRAAPRTAAKSESGSCAPESSDSKRS